MVKTSFKILFLTISFLGIAFPAWAQNYSLQVIKRGNGQVSMSPSGGIYRSNTLISLRAFSANGWTFIGWSGDINSSSLVQTFNIRSNMVVEANFATAVNTSVIGNGAVFKSPAQGPYPYGSTVRLTAVAAPGWEFIDWGGALSGSPKTNQVDLVVTNANLQVQARFRDLSLPYLEFGVIRFSGNAKGGSSVGSAWGDYDADGSVDLFVANFNGSNFLLHNNGTNTWTNVVATPIATDGRNGRGGAWADFDNDGELDLLATEDMDSPNRIYRNNDGVFNDLTSTSMATDGGRSLGASWGDYDNDGWIDLFIANFGTANFLYRNNGGGSFIRITEGPIAEVIGASTSGTWGDYDNDGLVDLFVTNYEGSSNFLFHNEGKGVFRQITTGEIVNDTGNWRGASWGDYDNDGYLDLFVAQIGGLNALYHNEQNGTFRKITSGPAVTTKGNWGGGIWADLDNDGFLDLIVGNINGPNWLLMNNQQGGFATIQVNDAGSGSYSTPVADVDHDGDLDLFAPNIIGGSNVILLNPGTTNNWLQVEARGGNSNWSAIGARIIVTANLGGSNVSQLRSISGGEGAGAQSMLTQNFGLREATQAMEVKVVWPSGKVSVITNVAINQKITVVEEGLGEPKVLLNGNPATANGGTFDGSVVVQIVSRMQGARIFYSLDGNVPSSNSIPYTTSFTLNHSAVIRTVVYDHNFTQEVSGEVIPVTINPTFTVETLVKGGGTISLNPGGGTYLSNTVVVATAVDQDGWTFLHWEGDVTGTVRQVEVKADSNKWVRAVFGTELNISLDGSGVVFRKPAQGPYPAGSSVELMAVSGPGWEFSHWEQSAINFTNKNPIPLELDLGRDVRAVFKDIAKPQITITQQPTNGVVGEPITISGTIADDSPIALARWELNGTSMGVITHEFGRFSMSGLIFTNRANTVAVIVLDSYGNMAKVEHVVSWHSIPIHLTGARITPQGFVVDYASDAGSPILVEQSSDLVHWSPIQESPGGTGSTTISFLGEQQSFKFFRVRYRE